MRSFGRSHRGSKVFKLDGWRSNLDRQQVHCWVVQVYRHVLRVWNLGTRSLVRLLFLKASASWKITKVNVAWNAFPLPSLDDRLLDGQWRWFVLNLDAFPLLQYHWPCSCLCSLSWWLPCDGEDIGLILYIYIYKWMMKCNGRHLLQPVVSSCARFSSVGSRSSPQTARRRRVTKLSKDLSEWARALSIRS